MKKNILFICTGNSVRSQMAHAFFNTLTNQKHHVYSAGITPAGIHPLTQKVMSEENVSMRGHTSNHVDEMTNISFDYIIVLCEVAYMHLPSFKGDYQLEKWFIDDPIRILGSPKKKLKGFRYTRNHIRQKVEDFIEKEQL